MLSLKVYMTSIYGDELIYDVELFNKVSVVLGNSAAGKSFLSNCQEKRKMGQSGVCNAMTLA